MCPHQTVQVGAIFHADSVRDLFDRKIAFRKQRIDLLQPPGGPVFPRRDFAVRQILAVVPKPQATERVQVAKPTSEGFGGGQPIARKPVVKAVKVGRNDPCPCGSGKKYKKCCGANEAADKD